MRAVIKYIFASILFLNSDLQTICLQQQNSYDKWDIDYNLNSEERAQLKARRKDLKVRLDELGPPKTDFKLLGNLLSVCNFSSDFDSVVYLSGNKLYMNSPPNVSLSRRTMLNVLFQNIQDAFNLVYMSKINALLEPIKKDVLIAYINEALNAAISDGYKNKLNFLNSNILGNNDLKALEDFKSWHNGEYENLCGSYNTKLKDYYEKQTIKFSSLIRDWKNNSATHTEIMFLNDIGDEKIQKDDFTIFTTKPMCSTCEPAIVENFKDKHVKVICEKAPSADEKKRNNKQSTIIKIHIP